MQADTLLDASTAEFLDRLASHAPTPGGGAVAALAGAQAAALGRMACACTLGQSRFADVEPVVAPLAERLRKGDMLLRTLVDEDARAYQQLMAAFKTPKDDPARPGRVSAAAETAALVPLESVALAREVRSELAKLAPVCNPNLRSDVEVGLHLADAAMKSAAIMVRVNLPFLPADAAKRIEQELARLLAA
jgi:formiminotetrahydrofolate cyclodeaminase